MSDDCTKSGASLWLMLDFFFMGLLLVELGFLRELWSSNPELSQQIAITASTASFGCFAGVVMLNQGLTNKSFDMRMRIALVAAGSVVAVGSLLTGAILGFFLH